MGGGNSIEKYGADFDPSQWKTPESEVLDVEKPEDPIEKVLSGQRAEQSRRENEYNEGVKSTKERVENLSPTEFVRDEIASWQERHKGGNVDTSSPFETAQFLLALLVEQGANWPPQKAQNIRKIVTEYLKRSFPSMKPEQREFLVRLETNPDLQGFEEPGEMSDEENSLIEEMMVSTPGNESDQPMLHS